MPIKPSETEEEYFARMEYERLKKSQEESQKKLATDQRAKEKELHYMKCPKCGMNLVEIDYKKIKVDKCSECEGICLMPANWIWWRRWIKAASKSSLAFFRGVINEIFLKQQPLFPLAPFLVEEGLIADFFLLHKSSTLMKFIT